MNPPKSRTPADQSQSTAAPDFRSRSERPLRDAVMISSTFFLIYTSFHSLQNMQSTLHQRKGLGMASLAALYGSTVPVSFVTPVVLHYTGVKACFVLSWLAHLLFVVCNMYPGWATMLPASVLLGCCLCPQWTASNVYVAALARVSLKKERLQTSMKRASGAACVEATYYASFSWLNGVFKAIYLFGQVVGNLVSSAILFQSSYDRRDGPGPVPPPSPPALTSSPRMWSYSAMTSSSECGATYCPLAGQGQHVVPPEDHVVSILLGVFMSLDIVAIGITYFCVPNLEQPRHKGPDVYRKLRSCWTLLSRPKTLLLIPCFVSRGMSLSLPVGLFTEAYVGCATGIHMVGYVMAVWGLCAVLAAVVFGHAARFTGNQVQCATAFAMDGAILIALLWWRPHTGSLVTIFGMASTMGIVGGLWITQGPTLVATLFPEAMDSAFTLVYMLASLSQAFFFVLANAMCPANRIRVSLGVLGVAIVSYFLAGVLHGCQSEVQAEREEEEEEEEEEVGLVDHSLAEDINED